MPIPPLDDEGFLPEGIHDASLEEVGQRFGQFQQSERRVRLQAALRAFAEAATRSGLVAALIVDGSFATGKAEPGDVDLIVVLRTPVDFSEDLRPDQYNVVSAKRVKARHGFDVFVTWQSSASFQPLVEGFSRVRDSESRKGMVRVVL